MNYSIQDIEAFIAGSDEINRKRKVISKVIFLIIGRFNALNYADMKWKEDCVLVQETIEDYGTISIMSCINKQVSFHIPNIQKGLFSDSGEHINYERVSVVYNSLPRFLNKVCSLFTNLGIQEMFNFFIKQNPTVN